MGLRSWTLDHKGEKAMSHFARIVCKYKDATILKQALAVLGIVKTEVHETPKQVRDYTGATTQNTANVIVPREEIGDSAADMGWKLGDNSEAWIDEYCNPVVKRHGGLAEFSKKVSREYACATIEQHAKARGKTPQRVQTEEGVKIFVNA